MNGRVASMRIMDPVPARGNAPSYTNGYVKYETSSSNGGAPQGVNPYTGNPGTPSEAHFPL